MSDMKVRLIPVEDNNENNSGSKGYYGYYFEYQDVNGKRKQVKRFGNKKWSKNKAKELGNVELESTKAKLENARQVLERKRILNLNPGMITLNELANLYVKDRTGHIIPRSGKDVMYTYNKHIKSEFGEMNIQDISPDMIRDWQIRLLEKKITHRKNKNGEYSFHKNTHLTQIQGRFKMIIELAVSRRYIEQNPFERTGYVKRQEESEIKTLPIMSVQDFQKLIEAINSTTDELKRLQDTLIFTTLYFVGLRKGELMALNFRDYCFEERTLSITKSYDYSSHTLTSPKTKNSVRKITVIEKVHTAIVNLKDYYERHNCFDIDLPIITYNGEPASSPLGNKGRLYETKLDNIRNFYFAKANLEHLKIHGFRHSYVTNSINAGVDKFKIAKYIGDSVEMVTKVYGHLTNDAQIEANSQLEKYIESEITKYSKTKE